MVLEFSPYRSPKKSLIMSARVCCAMLDTTLSSLSDEIVEHPNATILSIPGGIMMELREDLMRAKCSLASRERFACSNLDFTVTWSAVGQRSTTSLVCALRTSVAWMTSTGRYARHTE